MYNSRWSWNSTFRNWSSQEESRTFAQRNMSKGVMAETAGFLPVLYPLPPNCVFGGSEEPTKNWHFPDSLAGQGGPMTCKQKSLGGTWGKAVSPVSSFLLSVVWNVDVMASVPAAKGTFQWPWWWEPHTRTRKIQGAWHPDTSQNHLFFLCSSPLQMSSGHETNKLIIFSGPHG